MSRSTVFLARLLGLFMLLMILPMLLNRGAMVETTVAFMHDPPALLIFGMIVLAVGLAMVLSHNRWRGGALTVVVTLLGWVLLIRGLVVLCLPREMLMRFLERIEFAQHYYVFVAVPLILGLYLTIAGFSAAMPPAERG
jgi:hypothetical protein